MGAATTVCPFVEEKTQELFRLDLAVIEVSGPVSVFRISISCCASLFVCKTRIRSIDLHVYYDVILIDFQAFCLTWNAEYLFVE